jgi:DNA-binding transcriptional LysR family regulator
MIGIIQTMNLGAVDLNLLVALDALLREQSVTRAAQRVGLSQPAMSNALARLRTLVGDPLLVRGAAGMEPTARAKALADPVGRALGTIARALQPLPAFEPSSSTRTFRIAASDYVGFLLLPLLLKRLAVHAPHVTIEVVNVTGVPLDDLTAGRLDLAFGNFGSQERLARAPLLHEEFSCVVRARHPRIRRKLTLKQYVELPHILVSPRGRGVGVVDDALAKLGKRRIVAVTLPHFLLAPFVVAQSDCILTVPSRIARAFARLVPIRVLDPPLAVSGFDVAMLWHARAEEDDAHAWLRREVVDLASTIA